MELPAKMNQEVLEMLNGCESLDLASNVRSVARVTQYLIENGFEELWVSLCVSSAEGLINIATIQSDRHVIELENDMVADAVRIGAHSLIVGHDFWWIPNEWADLRFTDLSVHPFRQESIMVCGRHGRNLLVGRQLVLRRNGKPVFQSLNISPFHESFRNDFPSCIVEPTIGIPTLSDYTAK
jgi:hypothetical protein